MAGLFSGASTGPALEELGASIGKLGMTIYGKLDEAEATSEYNSGQLLLEKQMNAFDQQLSQDPNIDQWGDKNTKAMSDAWDQTTKSIKNPKAFNALNDWWVSQKISRDKNINGRVIAARINRLAGTLQSNLDTTMTDQNMTIEQKKERIAKLNDDAVNTMVRHPEEAAYDLANRFKTLDKNDLQSKGLDIMNQQGEEAGTQWMLDPKNSQTLNDEERKSVSTAAASSYKLVLAVKGKKAASNNSGNLDKVNDWIMTGDVPDDAYSQILKMDWQSVQEANVDGTSDKRRAYEWIQQYEKTASGKKGGGTVEEQDELFRKYYLEYADKSFQNTDANRRDLLDRAEKDSKDRGLPIDGFMRLRKTIKDEIPTETKSNVAAAAPTAPGETVEEKKVREEATTEALLYLRKNPNINGPGEQQKVVEDFLALKKSKFVQEKIATLASGEKPLLTKLFGNKSAAQKDQLGEFIQTGKMSELVQGGDTQATSRLQEYEDNAAKIWRSDTGRADRARIVVNPAPIKYGKFKGLRPIVQIMAGPDKNQDVYELRMNPLGGDKPGEYHWYTIPASKYLKAKDDSEWTLVK
jgi:hypothetical protein